MLVRAVVAHAVLVPLHKDNQPLNLEQWLRGLNFQPFDTGTSVKWENKPVSQGGILIEICGDVASIWCIKPKLSEACIPLENVYLMVFNALFN